MTQTRGRARTKTSRSRRGGGRDRRPGDDDEDRQEELIRGGIGDEARRAEDSPPSKNKYQRCPTPCKNIYVPPKLEQGLQGRDDKAGKQYQAYSSEEAADTPRGKRDEDDQQIDEDRMFRRVPSVIQDVADDDRQRARRLRSGHHERSTECDENFSLPSSYHYSNSAGSPPRKKKSTKCETQQRTKLPDAEERTRRRPPDDPPMKRDIVTSDDERYRRPRRQPTSSSVSEFSNTSSEHDEESRDPKPTRRFQQSYSSGLSSASGTFDTDGEEATDIEEAGSDTKHQKRLPIFVSSVSTMASLESVTSLLDDVGGPFAFLTSDLSGLLSAKQDVAVCTMILSSIELLVLMLQLTMCGIAPFQTNVMIGPFPDAFSIWGGKNSYLMLVENEWWRVVTPAFLSVGILHYALNVYCLLGTGALFEREWGWMPWVYFLFIGSIGCSTFSVYFEPDSVAVGSSGALLGLYGAKLAQIVLQTFCQAPKKYGEEQDDIIPLSYLGSVLFSLIILFVLGIFVSYIDFAGSCGGLLAGLGAGLLYFSHVIKGCCGRLFFIILGFFVLTGPIGAVGYLFVTDTETNEELSDVCQYFRSLFTEDYECGCMG